MDNKLEKIITMIESIEDELKHLQITMTKNTSSLDYHIERTNLAEEHIELAREEVKLLKEQMIEEFKPIKSHVSFVTGAIWALGIAGTIFLALNELGILKKLF